MPTTGFLEYARAIRAAIDNLTDSGDAVLVSLQLDQRSSVRGFIDGALHFHDGLAVDPPGVSGHHPRRASPDVRLPLPRRSPSNSSFAMITQPIARRCLNQRTYMHSSGRHRNRVTTHIGGSAG